MSKPRSAPAAVRHDADPSIAICYPSPNRLDKLTVPFAAAGLEFVTEPDAPDAFDVIMLDTPGARMIDPLVRADAPVVWRIRGNVWRASQYWRLGALKSELSTRLLFPRLDGALPADEFLESEFQARTRNTATDAVGLPIREGDWPTVEHTDETPRLVTLTNADYRGKVTPICERVDLVDSLLAETGGEWVIGGDGEFAEAIAAATADAERVRYGGYLDAKQALAGANILFHPSEFDIQLPNAVLEGMAAGLPVVTTPFPKFEAHRRLRAPRSDGELVELLRGLTDPERRAEEGARNREYVREHHTPETIGEGFRRFFAEVVE